MRAAAVLLVSLVIAATLAATGALGGMEDAALDARFDVRGAQPTDELAVVAIDEPTLTADGASWPLRRQLHADVIDALRRAGVRQIVYDVQFTEPSAFPRDDRALFAAAARTPGIILATGESDRQGRTDVLGGDENLREIGALAAAANLPGAGAVRRYERTVNRLDTLAAVTARRLGVTVADASALIDFRGPPGTIPRYSFGSVLAGKVDPGLLRDRVVVVGATAPLLQDLHPTSAPGGQMPGPEIQANAIWTALHGNPLQPTAGWIRLAVLLACALLGPAAVLRFGPGAGLILAVGIGAAYAVAAQLAFDAGWVLPVAEPLAALLAGAFVAVVFVTLWTIAERRRVQWRNEELESAVSERTAELEATQLEVLERLARAAELRDDDTGEHVDRMSRLCERVALALGWPAARADRLRQAATLHDIGKIGTPDGILRKPGRLDDEEVAIMRLHTTDGAAILAGSASPMLQLAERIALTHHERWDGTGYPARLAGEAIPIEGRIAAVCDVFDALVSERPYKRAWSQAEALAEISAQRGRHFDARVADALMTALGDTPFVADVVSEPAVEAPGASGAVAQRAVGVDQ